MPLTIRRRLVDRVRQLRKIAYAVCAALVVLAGAVVFLSISSPASSVEVASGPPSSTPTAPSAWRRTCGALPGAKPGLRGRRGVASWMEEKLSAFGTPVVGLVPGSARRPGGDPAERRRWSCEGRENRPSSSPLPATLRPSSRSTRWPTRAGPPCSWSWSRSSPRARIRRPSSSSPPRTRAAAVWASTTSWTPAIWHAERLHHPLVPGAGQGAHQGAAGRGDRPPEHDSGLVRAARRARCSPRAGWRSRCPACCRRPPTTPCRSRAATRWRV